MGIRLSYYPYKRTFFMLSHPNFKNMCGTRNLSLFVQGAILFIASLSSAESLAGQRKCQEGLYYHRGSNKCYEYGATGPCGNNAGLQSQDSDGSSGELECSCKSTTCNTERPQLYLTNGCYRIFDQGPCGRGYWLVPLSETSARCGPVRCWREFVAQEEARAKWTWSTIRNESYLFPYQGRCYRTEEDFPGCSKGQKVYLNSFEPVFKLICSGESIVSCRGTYITHSGVLKCADGQQADQYGGCNPVDSDF